MRITNNQVYAFEKCIIDAGLSPELFSKIQKDDLVRFIYKEDNFSFEMKKLDQQNYQLTITSIYHRSETRENANWETSYARFKTWCQQVHADIESRKKLVISEQPHMVYKGMNPFFKRISPKFHLIFFQAFEAENLGLNEICGIGFRKAYEFLIKDYVLRDAPKEDYDKIKNMLISDVVAKYISDPHINLIVKRVIWLGNDHAHYQPVFKNKTIVHLKELIYKTMAWMEAHEELRKLRLDAEKIEKQIPYKNKKS